MPTNLKTHEIYDLLFKEYIQMLRESKMPQCKKVFSVNDGDKIVSCCASGLWLYEKRDDKDLRLPSYTFFIEKGMGIIIGLNDQGKTFAEIADYLEQNPDEFSPTTSLNEIIRDFPSVTASLSNA